MRGSDGTNLEWGRPWRPNPLIGMMKEDWNSRLLFLELGQKLFESWIGEDQGEDRRKWKKDEEWQNN